MDFNFIIINIIIPIIVAVIGTGVIALIRRFIKKYQVSHKQKQQQRRIKKAERKITKKRVWNVALRKITGLIYQRGKVRCSEKRLTEIKLPSQLGKPVSGYLLEDFFTPDELLESSEEVTWDCWEESEFDWILNL